MTTESSSAAPQRRVVIVGGSGMVGGYALQHALQHPAIGLVTSIGRKTLGLVHPKLKQVLHQNFADCAPIASELSGQDVLVFCLGAYTGAVSDQEMRTITVDYTTECARVLRQQSPNAAFSFLSGAGADRTARSRVPFARYKGMAENALFAAGFPRLYVFRPGYIYPVQPRKEPNVGYRVFRAIYPAFRIVFPNLVVAADHLARAMVDIAVRAGPPEQVVLENRDIRAFPVAQL